ncbi:MAG: lysophospholipid acyltransferase family protein [Pyrinomonadaceae bacterium]
MKTEIEKVYRPASLAGYSFRQRVLIRISEWGFFFLIKAIGMTIRFETEGWENFEAIENSGKIPIYAFWHDRIFAGTYFFRNRGIVVITSQSFDGEYIARFIRRFGYGAIRGSSTRGGTRALVEMIRYMKRGLPMAFTVDGPKGPRYVAKPGPLLLAKKASNPIMPFVVELHRYVTVNSWDKLQIPIPFTRAKVLIGKPIEIEPDCGDVELENCRLELQTSLDELVNRAKQWRERFTH